MIDAYQYYQNMEENNIMLLFKGQITSELLSSILQITESKLEKINETPRTRKKVFNVLVECLQNVYHHIDPKTKSAPDFINTNSAVLMIGRKNGNYFIITGNNVLAEKVTKIKQRLDELNKMSKEELKTLYKDVLSQDQFSDKGGAGLGFIDILRKSGEKVEYVFRDIDEKFSFFTLKVNINGK